MARVNGALMGMYTPKMDTGVHAMPSDAALYEALKYRVDVDRFGTRRYYNRAGQRHREDGPAVEYADGVTAWYQNNLLHRVDGPAIMRPDGSCEWWINGTEYNERDYNKRLKTRGYA